MLDKVTFVMGPRGPDRLGEIDFAYVDADKPGYPAYYDAIVPKLRANGLLLLDNMLRGGRVLDPQDDSVRVTARAQRPHRRRPARGRRPARPARRPDDRHAGGLISRLRILPVGPLGSSSRKQIVRGYL